jgi:hypothetical protein
MKKKATKKVIKLSAETLHQLETKEAAAFGDLEGTLATRPGCCP